MLSERENSIKNILFVEIIVPNHSYSYIKHRYQVPAEELKKLLKKKEIKLWIDELVKERIFLILDRFNGEFEKSFYFVELLDAPFIPLETKKALSAEYTKRGLMLKGVAINLNNKDALISIINDHKKKIADELRKEGPLEWIDSELFGIGVDSYNRMDKFLELIPQLSDIEYWYGLYEAYTSSDNTYRFGKELKKLFTADRGSKEYIMTEDDRNKLQKFPPKLIIYRAMTIREFNNKDFGVSWTLNSKKAEYFANEYPRNHSTNNEKSIIHSIEIDKKDIIAYWTDREEDEIIVVL